MRKILLMAFAAVMFMACGGKSGSKATVEFLERMGVKTDSLLMLDDSLVISLDRQLVPLDAEQTVRLCGSIEPQVKEEEQLEGLVSVAAAKALGDGISLLFLWHEFGAGGVMYACTYDAEGRYADGIELGPWSHRTETPGDGTYTCEEEGSKGLFSGDGFALERNLTFIRKEEGMTAKWAVKKTYSYTIDDKGMIKLKETKVEREGNVPADRLIADDIADLSRISVSDPRCIELMERLALRDEVRRSDDHGYELAVEVAGVFGKAPATIVEQVARKHDGPLLEYVRKAVESGAIIKADFDAEVDRLADDGAKAALLDLTKGWAAMDMSDGDADDELGDVDADDFEEGF